MPLKQHHDFRLDDRGGFMLIIYRMQDHMTLLRKKKQARGEINPKKQ